MSIPMTFSKAELLAKLRALLPGAKKQDAAATKQHQADERTYLEAYRKAVKEACAAELLKPYEKIKFSNYVGLKLDAEKRPSCPKSKTTEIERLIQLVEGAPQERYTLKQNGKYHHLWMVLTAHVKTEQAVC